MEYGKQEFRVEQWFPIVFNIGYWQTLQYKYTDESAVLVSWPITYDSFAMAKAAYDKLVSEAKTESWRTLEDSGKPRNNH